MSKNVGIYIHIPFCKEKCKYCDFISFKTNENTNKQYIKALISEIKNTKFKNYTINTIYIGGGTPSYIDSKDIVRLLCEIRRCFKIKKNAEITIEVNPGTVNAEKLKDYRYAGINRLSIGLQETSNRLLNLIGRIHTYKEFLDTYNLAKEIGFENINVDLIMGIPTQSEDEVIESINQIIKLNPNHISIYSLILEENTVLKEMIDKKELELIDDSIERNMYWKTKKILEKNGYIHYEISNYAKKDCFSKHNLNCWNQEEYIGFGLAAHSYIKNKRFSNINNLEKYMKSIEKGKFEDNILVNEEQTITDKSKEFMILGLRKLNGISISEFEKKFKINPLFYFKSEINRLVYMRLLEISDDTIKLTEKGLDFANLVFEEFITT